MKHTVLIVDDSLTVRMDLGESFEEAGFQATLCATLAEARRSLARTAYALIVLDIVLPDGDGIELLTEIRRTAKRGEHTPVMLLSGEADLKARAAGLTTSADEYVGKPYDIARVVARASEMLRKVPGRSAAKRILAVDDSATYLHALTAQLREEGYDVVSAQSGEEALELLVAEGVDCILLDLIMPGLSGQDTCRRIKDSPAWRNIPLIMLTALEDREAMIAGIDAGADDYITKSGDFQTLKVRLRAQLRRAQLEEEHRSVREQLLRKEIEATEARAAREVAETKALLLTGLEEKNVELQRAMLIAERANLAKSEFLSSMSHELRSPLNAILGFAQLMESEVPPPTTSQKASIDQILHAGWHLLTLINEVLDLAKIESGKLSLSLESVSLEEVLVECQGMIEGQARKRGIEMSFPRFAIPCQVIADRTRLKQILINLLSNSIKYNREQGRVAVSYSVRDDTSTQDMIRVSVKDTGLGLSPEHLAQLFQPFNRLGQEQGAQEGTGIGLVVARQLIELMGGVIGVDSTLGEGSVFWFELRAATPAPESIVSSFVPTVPMESEAARGPRLRSVLYVEDNPTNLRLVEQLIARRPDLRLSCAVTGRLGIEHARTHPPDVILMDINLPDIMGIDALRILRNDPTTMHIPVVAVSANAMLHDVEKGLSAGFFRYLTKPLKIVEFMETLNAALELVDGAIY